MQASVVPGEIHLDASRALTAWMVCSSVGAISLSLLYLPLAFALGAACLVLLQLWSSLRLHALRRHPAAICVLNYGDGQFRYQLRAGDWHHGAIVAGGLVTRWLRHCK